MTLPFCYLLFYHHSGHVLAPDMSIADVNQDGVLDINDRLFLLEVISGVSSWSE